MSGGRKLSEEQLQGLEKEIVRGNDNLQSAVRNLHQILDTMEGRWKGIAAGRFDAKQREINERINRINKTLNKYLDAAQMMRSDKDDLEISLEAELGKIDPEVGSQKSAFSSYS
ncbi:WXG100 family type VII secretion target [Streptomyces sp. TRM66268-LWL]|uniref:WXG100 family type VII secretion target n=1 Tax=Streptomyces polyasparticus TaxID=2767826 RepID=A0ABR7SAX1_9ACTN|nr:WXG100 family type VII secretion target [Streptomyces polyasparticus]MBC9711762.1 WXG100 family type VII secretion target [Streptomyces polyasparticus]